MGEFVSTNTTHRPSRTRQQEHGSPLLSSEVFVKFNQPPSIIELLNTNPGLHISPEQFDQLVNKSRPKEDSYSLVQSSRGGGAHNGDSRKGDITGIVANFAGRGMTSDKVTEILTPICKEALEYIGTLDPDVQEEVGFYLRGRGVTPRALVVGNEVWKTHILDKVKKYREESPYAQWLRNRTGHELFQALYMIKKQHPFIDKKVVYAPGEPNHSRIYEGSPIQYLPTYINGSLAYLRQLVVGISFESVGIEDPNNFDHWTNVAEVIRSITPPIFQRKNKSNFDPNNPLTLLSVAGKISHPLDQALTEYLV